MGGFIFPPLARKTKPAMAPKKKRRGPGIGHQHQGLLARYDSISLRRVCVVVRDHSRGWSGERSAATHSRNSSHRAVAISPCACVVAAASVL
eukprot:772691-Alexandrium_andersonii.AAC.1